MKNNVSLFNEIISLVSVQIQCFKRFYLEKNYFSIYSDLASQKHSDKFFIVDIAVFVLEAIEQLFNFFIGQALAESSEQVS
ncbi:hypothetical protein BpHYR1_018485 [Brachionus plicatilis]|uniref:Uncharacterized protein n=1 Tax=Brachionus plicatilis TaxID=10195 RepID=A0A3M7Q064_BRAPC|nr:hypothetical protein BpHYR1_018485 [Brachionus plicatilis]